MNIKPTPADTISRQMAINALYDEFKRVPINTIRVIDTIKNLPSAQSEPQWIPCHDPSDLPKDKRIWITREYEVYGFRDVSNVIWDMTEWSDSVSGVVAYMPYWEPEPYTERKEE